LKKGDLIYLEGRITHRSWDDAETGQKKYATDIIGERFRTLTARGDSGETSAHANTSQTQPTQTKQLQEDDDLPF
jgi:single-strand DNA-binding protein